MTTLSEAPWLRFPRSHPWITGIVIFIVSFMIIFDWSWFRRPLESYVSNRTQRSFTISDLDVKLGFQPTIILHDLVYGNTDWGKPEPMAVVKKFEFTVSLPSLFQDKIFLPRLALTDARILMERHKDNRRNWTFTEPSKSASPTRARIGSLSVSNGHLKFFDYGIPLEVIVDTSTFDPAVQEQVKDADATPENNRYAARFKFSGKYRNASFSGNALTGEVLSFQETGVPFPLKGDLVAGTTKVDVEGSVADAVNITDIDVKLHISGRTLANLYPFLLLPLPASPPYDLRGHLVLKGDTYTLTDLLGKIGSTDVQGKASYIARKPRPLLTADLHSNLINMADLGPLIGLDSDGANRGSNAKAQAAQATQAKTSNRAEAANAARARNPERILPAGSFEGSRFQAIDADFSLEAKKLVAPAILPFGNMRAVLKLKDSVLKIEPLELGFAGGSIASKVTLDASDPTIKGSIQTDVRRLQLNRLMPDNPQFAKAAGTLGGKIDLRGSGSSIADMAGNANGTLSVAVARGRISNLMDALSALQGGKALQVLLRGDSDIAVNCGGAAFDVKSGKGTSTVLVVDTEQTQITGGGTFDLEQERFDIRIEPKPKSAGILSFRTPIRVYGSFRNPQLELEKGPIALRAGAALALAVINPLAALIPLMETGSGAETDCRAVFKSVAAATKQASAPTPARP